MKRCVIVGGADIGNYDFIREMLRADDYIVFCDSGLKHMTELQVKPDLIVGDFDSYAGVLPDGCEVIRLCPQKDDTDTMHCVTVALERGFRRFVLLAATGGRLDHTLANLCVLAYLRQQDADGEIVTESETIVCLTEGVRRFDGHTGQTFSVFPFGCERVILSYEGAQYPLDHGVLTNSVPMGVSNVFVSDSASVTVHGGQAVCFVIN